MIGEKLPILEINRRLKSVDSQNAKQNWKTGRAKTLRPHNNLFLGDVPVGQKKIDFYSTKENLLFCINFQF